MATSGIESVYASAVPVGTDEAVDPAGRRVPGVLAGKMPAHEMNLPIVVKQPGHFGWIKNPSTDDPDDEGE
jgi:hypothetical protein